MKILTIIVAVLSVSSVANAATYVFPGEAIEVPTSGPADPSFIYVEDVEGKVVDISIKFNSFSHRFAKETMVAISNPDGWATLMWDGVNCKFDSIEITISDEAATSLEEECQSGSYLESGAFRGGFNNAAHEFTIPIAPMRPLFQSMNELIMESPNGRWILWAEDFVSGDGGTVTGWELIIETEDPTL
jgi:hypothetical protein